MKKASGSAVTIGGMETYLPLNAVAGMLNVSRRTVVRMAQKNELSAYRIRGNVRISRSSIEKYLAAHQVGVTA